MNSKKNKIIWGSSLLIIFIIEIINSFSSMFGIGLSDMVRRGLGIIEVVMLPIIIYSSVKMFKCSKVN
ncbi:hypothetical protein [Clostridium sp. B9]|uniref:hypothetical protein n=1 Tax=Clostridium sp. B9 TaxID=3423224 RepID=UPI003D2EB797